jgi:ribonuclease HII
LVPVAATLHAGVDEAGRGPLAGAVYAAAVILDPMQPIIGLDDSKRLIAVRRERLDLQIRQQAIAFAVAVATVAEIDEINILKASLLAMQRAVAALGVTPSEILVDGNQVFAALVPIRAVVGGDALVPAIAAASILAKVARDAEMVRLDQEYPGYGFAQHKGYPTAAHLAALRALGVSPVHRRTYAPVRALLPP